MTKHIGPMILLIIIAGIVLYAAQHYTDLIDGVRYLQDSVDVSKLPKKVDTFFKQP